MTAYTILKSSGRSAFEFISKENHLLASLMQKIDHACEVDKPPNACPIPPRNQTPKQKQYHDEDVMSYLPLIPKNAIE